MQGIKSKASQEELLDAFESAESFRDVARRFKIGFRTLRAFWKASFGEEAYVKRGKKLQSEAATKTCLKIANTKVYKEISIACSKCGASVVFKTNQVSQMSDILSFICVFCRCDRKCPVCDSFVNGNRGLSTHFRHRREAGDAVHIEYEKICTV